MKVPSPARKNSVRRGGPFRPGYARDSTTGLGTLFPSFNDFKTPPQPAQRHQRTRICTPDADPGPRDPAGARRPGCAGVRADRQRQDRGVPAADPPPVDGQAARHHARAGARRRRASSRRRSSDDLNDLAVHTPITGAAVFGGVGMGPQEHAFRSGVDVLIATPGRLLDHFAHALRQARRASSSWCSTKPTACSTWASCRTSAACCSICRRSGRRCSSARRCRRRSRR